MVPPRVAVLASLLVVCAPAPVEADLPVESIGRVESLPYPAGPHEVWVAGGVLRRLALVDTDDGRMLGIVGSGFGMPALLVPSARGEIYVPETHYSRGSRGERSDVLTIYDARSLAPVAEVALPPKRAHSAVPVAHAALSDDDRFAALWNFTPATSLSIVDLEARRFVAEVETPGCSLVYGAGARRFAMLCMDGALLLVSLDEAGRVRARWRSEPFFDPVGDPVTEKAVRWGDRWLFVSFEGYVHPVDISGEEPRFEPRWSLLDAGDRDDEWRVGGTQHLAVHQTSGRLYSLVHQGGADTHKDPGTEVWVYDLSTRERVRRIELETPGLSYLGVPIEFEQWPWPFDRLAGWALGAAIPGVDCIWVTQDDEPLLVTSALFSGGIATYDAGSGAFVRRVYSGNAANVGLHGPRRAP